MSLDLSDVSIIEGGELEERAGSVYDMLDVIKESMHDQLGVTDMPAPKVAPTPLTEVDVATIDNRELGALYTAYVAYSVFLNTRLSEILSLERAARGNLKKVVARLKNQLRADGVKETHVAAQVETHGLYEEYYVEHLKLYMMKEIVEAQHKAYRDMAAALSRNVSLRELEFEQQRRDNNIQKSKGKGAGTPLKRSPFSGRRGT